MIRRNPFSSPNMGRPMRGSRPAAGQMQRPDPPPQRAQTNPAQQAHQMPDHPLIARQERLRYEKTVYPAAQPMQRARSNVRRPVMEILPLDTTNPAISGFLQDNQKTGYLKLRVTTQQGAIPISGANISVYLTLNDVRHLLVTDHSDLSGTTQAIPLPAPDRQLTLDPRNPRPYANYSLVLTHPGYQDVEILDIPVFDDVTSVQPVDMVPFTAVIP